MKLFPWSKKNKIQIPPPRLQPGAGDLPFPVDPDMHPLPIGPKQPPGVTGGVLSHQVGMGSTNTPLNVQPDPFMNKIGTIPVGAPGTTNKLEPVPLAAVQPSGSGDTTVFPVNPSTGTPKADPPIEPGSPTKYGTPNTGWSPTGDSDTHALPIGLKPPHKPPMPPPVPGLGPSTGEIKPKPEPVPGIGPTPVETKPPVNPAVVTAFEDAAKGSHSSTASVFGSTTGEIKPKQDPVPGIGPTLPPGVEKPLGTSIPVTLGDSDTHALPIGMKPPHKPPMPPPVPGLGPTPPDNNGIVMDGHGVHQLETINAHKKQDMAPSPGYPTTTTQDQHDLGHGADSILSSGGMTDPLAKKHNPMHPDIPNANPFIGIGGDPRESGGKV